MAEHAGTILASRSISSGHLQAARHILELLDAPSFSSGIEHLQGAGEQRRLERRICREVITVDLAEATDMAGDHLGPLQFEAVCRNISDGGIAFIHLGYWEFDHVTLTLPSGEGPSQTRRARCVHSLPVQDGWWEYGLAFCDLSD